MTLKEFNPVFDKNWTPIQFSTVTLPEWAANIPDAKMFATFASGSLENQNPEIDGNKNVTHQVGGIDVFRVAEPKDGVSYNKDHYRVLIDPVEPEKLIVIGPFKDREHWIDEVPDRLLAVDVIK